MTVISDVYFNVEVILSKVEITSNNSTSLFLPPFLLADDPFYFVLLLYLKFNRVAMGNISKKG